MILTNPTTRYIAGLVLLASLVWGPWWLTWALAIALLFIFPSYYEILAAGAIYDALYGLPLPQFYNFPYVFTVASIVLFITAHFLRQKLIIYVENY